MVEAKKNPNRLHPPQRLKYVLVPAQNRLYFALGDTTVGLAPTYRGLADRLAAGAASVAKAQGHAPEMAVAEKKSVVYNIRLSDEPFALIGAERISLGEARVTGVIEYVEQPGQPLCKILVRLDDQQPIVACAVFEMSGGNLGGLAFDGNRQFRFLISLLPTGC